MAVAGSLDTNVILRLLLNDVPDQHDAAVNLLHSSIGPFAVSDVAIIEVAFVLERIYKFNRASIAYDLANFLHLPKIQCNRTLFVHTLPMFVENPALSFEDCCLAVYAELDHATPLWTFDRKLAHQAHTQLVA